MHYIILGWIAYKARNSYSCHECISALSDDNYCPSSSHLIYVKDSGLCYPSQSVLKVFSLCKRHFRMKQHFPSSLHMVKDTFDSSVSSLTYSKAWNAATDTKQWQDTSMRNVTPKSQSFCDILSVLSHFIFIVFYATACLLTICMLLSLI